MIGLCGGLVWRTSFELLLGRRGNSISLAFPVHLFLSTLWPQSRFIHHSRNLLHQRQQLLFASSPQSGEEGTALLLLRIPFIEAEPPLIKQQSSQSIWISHPKKERRGGHSSDAAILLHLPMAKPVQLENCSLRTRCRRGVCLALPRRTALVSALYIMTMSCGAVIV